jgi:hypothetical protein
MIMEPDDCWVVINMRPSLGIGPSRSTWFKQLQQGIISTSITPCPVSPTGEHIASANYLTTIDYSTEHNGECVAVMQCSECLWSAYVTYVLATEAITDYLIDEDGNVWMDGEGNDYPHHSTDLTI